MSISATLNKALSVQRAISKQISTSYSTAEKIAEILQALVKATASESAVLYTIVDKNYLENAQKWLSMRDNCDKRRNYNEKDCFEILTKNISEALDVDRMEIYRIDICGYERYAYSVYFTISEYDYNFVLEIPVINAIAIIQSPKITLIYIKATAIIIADAE